MFRLLALALIAMTSPAAASTFVLDDRFTSFDGSGLSPGGSGGTLDSSVFAVLGASDGDVGFGTRHVTGDYARGRSSGEVRTGGLYAFLLPGGDTGVGVQATASDFSPGALVRRVVNETGRALEDLTLTLDYWFLNNGSRSTLMGVDVLFSSQPLWHPLPDAGLATPLDATPGTWERVVRSVPVPGGVLAADATLLLRWHFDDHLGVGARDEIALSRLRLTARDPDGDAAVELGAPAGGGAALTALLLAIALVRSHRRGRV